MSFSRMERCFVLQYSMWKRRILRFAGTLNWRSHLIFLRLTTVVSQYFPVSAAAGQSISSGLRHSVLSRQEKTSNIKTICRSNIHSTFSGLPDRRSMRRCFWNLEPSLTGTMPRAAVVSSGKINRRLWNGTSRPPTRPRIIVRFNGATAGAGGSFRLKPPANCRRNTVISSLTIIGIIQRPMNWRPLLVQDARC